MDKKYFVTNQEEQIYFSDEKLEMVNNKTLLNFFQELLRRKRNTNPEDGLQASIVLLPHKLAAKVAENDGTATHLGTECNLFRFLNGQNEFFAVDCPLALYNTDMLTLLMEGITIQILNAKRHLRITIDSSSDISSLFEIRMLQKIVLLCQELLDKKHYDTIEIGLYTDSLSIEPQALTNEHFDFLMQTLMHEKEHLLNLEANKK